MLDRLGFIIGEAATALRRNSLMSLAAITTVAVSLFILGGMGYAYYKLYEYAQTLPVELDARVYLKDQATMDDVHTALREVRAMPEVESAYWIPADAAWKKFLDDQDPKARALYAEFTDMKPYPEALKVVWKDLSKADDAAAKIEALPYVQKVSQPEKAQKMVGQSMKLLRGVGLGLGGILFLTGGILIYNAIRLTILSRRREIRIMQLTGASRSTIRMPFVIEGIVHGLLGGLLAWGILLATQTRLQNYLLELGLTFDLTIPKELLLLIICGIGSLYGICCSIIATREATGYR